LTLAGDALSMDGWGLATPFDGTWSTSLGSFPTPPLQREPEGEEGAGVFVEVGFGS